MTKTKVPVGIDSAGLTDVGRQRRRNEDHFLIASINKGLFVDQTSLSLDDRTQLMSGVYGKLIAVADGMGGGRAGDRASELAMQAVTQYVLDTMPWFFMLDEAREDDLEEELIEALRRAKSRVVGEGERRGLENMGTTLTMAYILWPRLYVVHVGDSRCYLLRDGALRQLTTDHSVAQQLVERGAMPAQEAADSRWANVLHKAIVAGDSSRFEPDVSRFGLRAGDVLLICSDGLTNQLTDAQIGAVLERGDAAAAAEQLVAAANEAGGADNITVAIARFES